MAFMSEENKSDNAQTSMAALIGDVVNKRETLAADTAYKARVNEIAVRKNELDAQLHASTQAKNWADVAKTQAELAKIPLEMKKLDADRTQSLAAAGASSTSNLHERVYDAKDGTTRVGEFRGGKLVNDLRKATDKDIRNRGDNRPWDSNISVAGAVGNLSREIDSKGNVTNHPKIDTVKFNAMKKQVEAEGGELKKYALDEVDTPGFGSKKALEIPVVVMPGAKVTMDDIVNALMSIHGYSREDAIAQYNQTVINAQKKRSGK